MLRTIKRLAAIVAEAAIKICSAISVILLFVELNLHNKDSFESPIVFLAIERFFGGLFMFDFAVRLKNGGIKYLKTPLAFVDFISFAPFLAGFFLPMGLMGYIRSLRVLRLLKWFRYSKALQSAAAAFADSYEELRSLAFISLVIFSLNVVLIHEIEKNSQPEMASILNCVWYVLVTATTVGYGDLYPVTITGKAIVSVTLFLPGLFIFSAVVGTISDSFARLHSKNV